MPTAERHSAAPIDLGAHFRASDAVLVRRMRRGDEGAFETIFQRHHAPLLSYCRHTLGNQDEAEDALQQAFIKAHQALLHGTAPRELRPWLYTIARNCCLSAITARRGWVGIESLEDHTPALVGLSDQVRQREDLRELVAGIGRLPEDQRSALLLAELDDLNHQAIATIVGCEVSKVKALIYQARSALIADRDALGASCQDIREQLAVARGGELRRGPLRRHLKLCVGCRDFQLAVGAQRQSLGAVLPVLPSAGLAAAILGHGAAHAVGAASIGGAGAGGAGVGATAASTGGVGIAASGTAASTAAASASAGAGGGTGIGAIVGGGVVTKLAVGGAVIALASAGAVTVHNREAHASPHRATRSQLAFASAKGRRISTTDIAYSSSPSAPAAGSPSALAPGDSTSAAGIPGSEPAVQLSGLGGAGQLGGAGPLLTPAAALTPGTSTSSGAAPGSSGQPAVSTGQGKGDTGRKSGANPAALAKHRAALRRRRMLARRRALLRRRRLEARRRARLRKALRRRHRLAVPKPSQSPPVKPPVTPAPVRVPHRKARVTPASGTVGAPTETITTGSTSPEAREPRRRTPAGTGTGTTSTGAGSSSSGTGTTGSGTGKPGSGKTGTDTGTGKTGKGAGTGETGTGSSGTGKENAGTEKANSGTSSGKTSSGKTSGTTGETGSAKVSPKKHLVEEEQLPNL
jgi:RNA polymerase sigma factor (sigma-70 family)